MTLLTGKLLLLGKNTFYTDVPVTSAHRVCFDAKYNLGGGGGGVI